MLMGANAVNETPVSVYQAEISANPSEKIAFITAAINDSLYKCQDFIDKLTGDQAKTNLGTDLWSLLFSGMASAISGPTGAIRGLAASSTFMQGAKQAINSDYFENMTTLLLVQQIQVTYYDQIQSNVLSLSGQTNLSPAAYLTKIIEIHRNCSIPFAIVHMSQQNSQNNSLANGAASNANAIVISGNLTVGDTIALKVTSTLTGLNETIPSSAVAVQSTAPLAVAYALASAINEDTTLKGLGIVAAGTNATTDAAGPPAAKFSIRGGPADLTWTPVVLAKGGKTKGSEKISVPAPAS